MFCPNCGKRLPDGSQFCDGCGSRQETVPPVQQGARQERSVQPPVYHRQPQKKLPWGLIGGIAAAAAVLVAALFVYPGFLRPSKANTYPSAAPAQAVANTSPTSSDISSGNGGSIPDQSESAEPPAETAQNQLPETSQNPGAEEAQNPGAEAARNTASFYSTDENASALEFDWFLDLVLSDGAMFTEMFMDAEDVTDPALLDGGWKAFLRGNGESDYDLERYLHADLLSNGGYGKITLRWKYLFDPASGESIEEDGSHTFSGAWEDGQLYTTSALGNIKLDRFFAKDARQYAYGTFQWNSGEIDYIALMRP